MKAINLILTLVLSLTLTIITVNKEERTQNVPNVSEAEAMTFTVNGSISSGHPNLSWSSVSGADNYKVIRLPVAATGYSNATFGTSGTNYTDGSADVIQQTGGLCQIRYFVEAYDDDTYLERSNSVNFITTTDADALFTGECNEP